MKIYINNQQVRAQILPANTPTKDETLETFSFALISNDNPLPYAPMQKVDVDIKGDGTDVLHFYLVTDSVETFSLNPLKYKHTLSCIQNTRILSKHLVRNSTFSSNVSSYKKSFNSVSRYNNVEHWEGDQYIVWDNINSNPLNGNSTPLRLEPKEKALSTAKLVLSFQLVYGNGQNNDRCFFSGDCHNADDVMALTEVEDLSFSNVLIIRYKNAQNETRTFNVYPENLGDPDVHQFDVNHAYEFPVINSLIAEGCNDFEVLFPSYEFLTGGWVVDPHYNKMPMFWMAQATILIEKTAGASVYEILDLLIKRQQKETSIRFDSPLFNLPHSTDTGEKLKLYNLLVNTPAPNFVFTQLTMYECVAEVFRLFDAIFTLDENDTLGIEYFNDLSKERIEPKITGRTLSLSEDKYINGLVSYYQDGKYEESFPSDNGLAHLRSAEFGVPEAQDHNFIVPHNIDHIKECKIEVRRIKLYLYGRGFNASGGYIEIPAETVLDITDYVVEQTVWSALDTGNPDSDKPVPCQANTIYYTRGDNKIQVAFSYKSTIGTTNYSLPNLIKSYFCRMADVHYGYFIEDDGTIKDKKWNEIRMRATYVASVDGETKVHSLENKCDGEMLVDQANGAVDLNKMGLNMLGLSLKLGNPTLNATHRITNWENRIRTGQVYEYQGRIWVANVVNYTFFKGKIQGKVTFVQNFNALSMRTKILKEKRMTNISKELVQKSEEIITDFVYMSSTEPVGYSGNFIHFDKDKLWEFIRTNFYANDFSEKVGDAVFYKEETLNETLDAIYIPIVKYGAGNTINYEMAFEHPMNAGNQTIVTTTNWLGQHKYFTTYVKYTDDYGYLEKACLKANVNKIAYTTLFPKVSAYSKASQYGQFYFAITDFKCYKQANEIFALNYQLAFLPLPNRENIDFIGNEFIVNNNLVRNIVSTQQKRYIAFKEEKSSVLDSKATNYFLKKEITDGVFSHNVNNNYYVNQYNFESITDAQRLATKSWAIVDENDNVLFASNNVSFNFNQSVTIYYLTKLNRI